jgi:hypothetical protein
MPNEMELRKQRFYFDPLDDEVKHGFGIHPRSTVIFFGYLEKTSIKKSA